VPTSLLKASLKLNPEWPVISQTNRFYMLINMVHGESFNDRTTNLLIIIDSGWLVSIKVGR